MRPFGAIKLWLVVLLLSGAGMFFARAESVTSPLRIPANSTNATGMVPEKSTTVPARMIEVSAREEGGISHFYAHNTQLAPVTVTFDVRLSNMQADTHFPHTTTLPAGRTVEVFALTPIKASEPWDYRFTDSSVLGDSAAVHDDAYVYSLPYATGSSFKVTQGYHGKISHTGPDEYSIDWKMPVGTPVHAARGGLVIKSKDDSNVGGPSRKFEDDANCILILHDDGTIGMYGHLKLGGNRVKVGDRVKEGDFIALSGNTGFSNGPHLHFSVFKAKDGWQRETLPVMFRSANHGVATLASGQSYQAAPVELRMAERSATVAGNSPSRVTQPDGQLREQALE